MTTTELPPAKEASLGHDVLDAARYYLGGRRGLVVLAAAVVVAGLAFNWSWLVAAGIAPLLVAALPCVAMCALGLCMSRMTGRSCSTDAVSQKPIDNDQMNQMTGDRDKAVQVLAKDAVEGVPVSREVPVKPESHRRRNIVRL
jgi:hypothetical protein